MTVNDNEIYDFSYLNIKELPDKLANYLIFKFPNSFKTAIKAVNKKIINLQNKIIEKDILIYYYKKTTEKIFNKLPISSQDVKLI